MHLLFVGKMTYSVYEVCPKSSWTSLVEVLDKHISLKAFAFHEVQHQLNKWSKFHEYDFLVSELHYLKRMWGKHHGAH